MQLAESQTERLVLLHARPLVVEEDRQMLEERVMHLFELPVVERLGKVDTEDLGADVGRQLAYFYGPVVHTYLPHCQHSNSVNHESGSCQLTSRGGSGHVRA